MFNVLYVENNM